MPVSGHTVVEHRGLKNHPPADPSLGGRRVQKSQANALRPARGNGRAATPQRGRTDSPPSPPRTAPDRSTGGAPAVRQRTPRPHRRIPQLQIRDRWWPAPEAGSRRGRGQGHRCAWCGSAPITPANSPRSTPDTASRSPIECGHRRRQAGAPRGAPAVQTSQGHRLAILFNVPLGRFARKLHGVAPRTPAPRRRAQHLRPATPPPGTSPPLGVHASAGADTTRLLTDGHPRRTAVMTPRLPARRTPSGGRLARRVTVGYVGKHGAHPHS
ncbi:MAG: hypothetical protein JWM61_1535 [Micrococcaceae bacterium]|nr:hypothetical protein [Micrococcaceae bacterium]